MSTTSELGHLVVPINFLAQGENRWHTRVSNPGFLDPESYESAVAPHWLGKVEMMENE